MNLSTKPQPQSSTSEIAARKIIRKHKPGTRLEQVIRAIGDLTIRSNLADITYANSDMMAEKQITFFSAMEDRKDVFINLSQGIRQTTLIVSQDIVKDVESIFLNERLLSKITGVSSITIRLSKDSAEIPGVYYTIMKLLAWEGINIVEVVSTHTELTIVLASEDIGKAFLILSDYQKQ